MWRLQLWAALALCLGGASGRRLVLSRTSHPIMATALAQTLQRRDSANGSFVPATRLHALRTEDTPEELVGALTGQEVGAEMQSRWDRLRSRPVLRYVELNAFMVRAAWRVFRANRTNDEALTNATATWVRDGLLRLGPTMIKLGQVFPACPPAGACADGIVEFGGFCDRVCWCC